MSSSDIQHPAWSLQSLGDAAKQCQTQPSCICSSWLGPRQNRQGSNIRPAIAPTERLLRRDPKINAAVRSSIAKLGSNHHRRTEARAPQAAITQFSACIASWVGEQIRSWRTASCDYGTFGARNISCSYFGILSPGLRAPLSLAPPSGRKSVAISSCFARLELVYDVCMSSLYLRRLGPLQRSHAGPTAC